MADQVQSSLVVRLKENQQNVTIERVQKDLQSRGVQGLYIAGKYLYQGTRFVSSLGANMLVIAVEFTDIRNAALLLPYFEKVEL